MTTLAVRPCDEDLRSISARADLLATFVERMAEELAELRALLSGVPAGTATVPPKTPAEAPWLSTIEAATVLGVNRKTLDVLARANLDVPGGPVVVAGRKRLHLRWPPTGLPAWLADVRAKADPAKPPPAQARRPPRRKPAPNGADQPTDWAAVRRRLLRGE